MWRVPQKTTVQQDNPYVSLRHISVALPGSTVEERRDFLLTMSLAALAARAADWASMAFARTAVSTLKQYGKRYNKDVYEEGYEVLGDIRSSITICCNRRL